MAVFDYIEETVIFVVSYGYYFASIPFVIGTIAAVLKAYEVF